MQVADKPTFAAVEMPVAPVRSRLDWVDNLRTLMILLVVNMHACVTYTWVGSWYYNSPPEPSLGVKIPFLFWQGHLQAFFMGLLFFIAGYYADRSLAKRGAKAFLIERMRRLGIPVLIYMLAIHPLIVIGLHPGYPSAGIASYLPFITSGRFLSSSGPMWFAFALLIFSAVFAFVSPYLPKVSRKPLRVTGWGVLGLGVFIALFSFLIRTVQPLGTSILNFQLCYFAQYLVVFPLGIWVSRRDVLAQIAGSEVAKWAGILGLVLGPVALLGVLAVSLPLPAAHPYPFEGGWNPISLAMCLWEQVAGVAIGLGAMALCVRKLNVKTAFSAWLSDRSFAVYMLHAPVLVGISLLLQPYRSTAFVMVPIVTVLALAAGFLVADGAKRIPGLRSVL